MLQKEINMKKNHGFTLLEIVVSIFLMSIAILVIQASVYTAVQNTRGQYYFQYAVSMAESMCNYLEAHNGDASSYLPIWQNDVACALPSATSRVSVRSSSAIITLAWGKETSCQKNKPGASGCVRMQSNFQRKTSG